MKKRVLAVVLAAALVLCVLPGTRAAELICFVGVNDSVPYKLPASEAPYYSGGILYIPYTAFNAAPNGVVISNNVDQNTLVLFTRNSRLVYDLEAGTVTDEDDNVSKVTINYRGGVMFLPAVQAASHFGLSVSLLTSETGCPVLRFTNGQQVYDNTTFVEKAESLISYILEHEAKQEAEGSQEQEEGIKNPEEEQEELGPATVYLAFAGDAVSLATLEYLKAVEVQAAFFLTAEQLTNEKDLVRKIYAAGHTIGVTCEPGSADPASAFDAANEAMDLVLFCRSPLAMLPDGKLETERYVLLQEQDHASTVQDVLLQEEQIPRLLICRADAAGTLTTLTNSGAFLPQLLETTRFP